MATDIETSYSPENINTLVEGINSGRISMSQVPTHVQSELQSRGVQFPQQQNYDFIGNEQQEIEFDSDSLRQGTINRSTTAQGDQYLQAVGLRAHVAGTDVFDEMLNFMLQQEYNQDAANLRDVEATKAKEQAKGDNISVLRGEITDSEQGNEELMELSEDVYFNNQEIDLTHPTRLWLDIIADPRVEDRVKQREAGRIELAQILKDIADDMGFLDTALGYGASFIPFYESGQQLRETGSLFNSQDWVNQLVHRVRSLDPEVRAEAIESLKTDILPNMTELRQISLLEALMAPEGSENTLDWSWLNPVSDIAGVLTGATAAKIFGKVADTTAAMASATRTPRVLRDMGNPEQAAEIASGAIVSRSEDVMGPTLGGSTSAANTASPFVTERVDFNSIDNISVPTMRRIDEFDERVKNTVQEMAEGDVVPILSFLSQRNAQVIHDDILRKYQKKVGIDNVQVTREGNSFKITYDEIDENNNIINAGRVDEYTANLDDLGSLNLKDLSLGDRWLHSPLVTWKGTDLEEYARVAQQLDGFQAKLLNDLRKLQREAVSPIIGRSGIKGLSPTHRQKLQDLDAVLMKGNLNRETYTPEQLRNGTLGFKLDDTQIESYYNVRSLMDGLYYLRNSVKRKELDLKGLKNINFDDAVQEVARPFEDAAAAGSSIRATGHRVYYDTEDGIVKELADLNLDDIYANNKVLIALEEPSDLGRASTKVYYSVVDRDMVTDLPDEVIPYVEGYVPQISRDAVYFAKVRTRTSIDGHNIDATDGRSDVITVREFDNKADADRWVFEQNLALREQGVPPSEKIYESLEDRQLERERAASGMGRSFSGGGGLYTGRRSQNEILFGLEGRPREMVNSFEAISRNLSALSKYVPRNEWRIGLETQAVNTANRLMRAEGGMVFKSFEDLSKAPDTPDGKTIKTMYRQIRDWNGMPTSTELFFQERVRGLIDSSIGSKLPGVKNMLLNVRQKDPVGAMRAAAFHPLLGFFNPRQYWIQAQGLAVAASMNILDPVNLGRVIRDQTALQFLQHMEGTPKQIAHIAKSTGMDKKYLTDLYNAWKRSGLQDSVLTNADHAAAGVGHGVGMDSLSRAADAGLFFYRGGELLNRRFSFATAFREQYDAARAAKKGFVVNDEVLGTILDRANNLMLNMGKGNRAAWQRGALSLTFQFNQINQKVLESALGMNGNFTMPERAKIFAGQVGLYGAAGIPMGAMGAHWAMEAFGLNNQQELESRTSPEAVAAINQGFVGWLALTMFGADTEISSDSSLAGGMEQFVDDLFFAERSFAETVFGAFGGVSDKFFNELVLVPQQINIAMLMDRPLDIAKAIGNPFLATLSFRNNIQRAMFMHRFNRLPTPSGQTIVSDFSLGDKLFQVAGFRTREEADYYRGRIQIDSNKEYLDFVTENMVNLYYQVAARSLNKDLSQDELDAVSEAMAVLVQGLNEYEETLVRERVKNNLQDTNTLHGQMWDEYRRYNSEGNINNLIQLERLTKGNFSQMRNMLQAGGVLREGVYDEAGEE